MNSDLVQQNVLLGMKEVKVPRPTPYLESELEDEEVRISNITGTPNIFDESDNNCSQQYDNQIENDKNTDNNSNDEYESGIDLQSEKDFDEFDL